jgi:LysM repeat protein
VLFPRAVHFRLTAFLAIFTVAKFFEGKFRSAKLITKYITSKKGRTRAKSMNNPNPFLPQASLLERQNNRRSRLKLAVFCVLLVSVTGLVAMLIQGCKRNNPDSEIATLPPAETNSFATDTNFPPMETSNATVAVPPVVTNPAPAVVPLPPVEPVAPVVPVAPATGSEYAVAKGDSLAKIAKNHGVSLKALEAANPTVQPTKLKIGQKLVIPAGTKAANELTAPTVSTPAVGTDNSNSYVVKANDSLTKIAKIHGVTVKAIKTANSLTTDQIKVGQKLKIPAKAEKATVAPAAPAPVVESAVAPAAPALPAAPVPTAPVNH